MLEWDFEQTKLELKNEKRLPNYTQLTGILKYYYHFERRILLNMSSGQSLGACIVSSKDVEAEIGRNEARIAQGSLRETLGR